MENECEIECCITNGSRFLIELDKFFFRFDSDFLLESDLR